MARPSNPPSFALKFIGGSFVSPKSMILQGVGHPISPTGVCYANNPQKGSRWRPRLRLIQQPLFKVILEEPLSPKCIVPIVQHWCGWGGPEGGEGGGVGVQLDTSALPTPPPSLASANPAALRNQ